MRWHRIIGALAMSLAMAGGTIAQSAPAAGSEVEITWPTLEVVAKFAHEGAGRSAYDAASNMLFVAGAKGVGVIHLGQGNDAALVRTINPALESGLPEPEQATITSVVCDPRGRGVAVALVVPKDKATVPGRAVFFETRTGKVLSSITVGYEPVYALWSFGGASLYVANKGSAAIGRKDIVIDPPGTISWIDLDKLSDAAALGKLSQSGVTTISPGGDALGETMPTLRIHPEARMAAVLDLEPTSIAEFGNWLIISFQANNAIGIFDLMKGEWRKYIALGAIDQRLDACALDGANVMHELSTLPMPHDLAIVIIRGDPYIMTANTGAGRGRLDRGSDNAYPDAAALAWMVHSKKVDDSLFPELDLTYQGIGGIELCAITGDEDGDGVIDRPSALGSRSVSLWDVTTGRLVGDTGAAFEDAMAERAPGQFNAIGGRVDAGSIEQGCRPGTLQVMKHGGANYAFVGLDRPGAIAIVDVTKEASPKVVDVLVSALDGDHGATSLMLIGAKDNPSGDVLLVAGYEGSGTVVVYRVAIP